MPVALIALCALPLTAGAVRLVTLAVGVEITPEAGVTSHILARGLPTANDAIRAVHGGEDPLAGSVRCRSRVLVLNTDRIEP